MNIYLIVHYNNYPDSIHTIIALYWIQSVLIGLFNFLDILTAGKVIEGSITIGNKPGTKGCSAFFFLFHYGFFHFVYFIFLVTSIINPSKIERKYLLIALLILVAGLTFNFVKEKFYFWGKERNLGYMVFLPYLRIIPMHLMILIPSFFHISNFIVFLVLKTVFDAAMHIVHNRITYKTAIS